MTDQEQKAMEMALEALERSMEAGLTGIKVDEAITAVRIALDDPLKSRDAYRVAVAVRDACHKAWVSQMENWRGDINIKDIIETTIGNQALAQPEHTSSAIQRAEFVVSNLRQRNEKTWDELDREAVFAINGLVEFAKFQFNRANAALRQALAQPEQEPVAWVEHEWGGSGLRHLHFDRRKPTLRDEVLNPVWTPLYTAPPSKPWVSLTDEELEYIYKQNHNQYGEDITGEYERELEAKLREKNT